jgi:hypothetical protein
MKKFLLFLMIIALPCTAFAAHDVRQGILKGIVDEDPDDFIQEDTSFFHPLFSNQLVTDVNVDDFYQATDHSDQSLQTNAKARLYSSLNFNKNLSLNGFFKMDRMRKTANEPNLTGSSAIGGNSFLKDEGIFIDELNLSYDSKNYALVAGKFILDYGTAWKWNRGIWTYQMAEQNYKQEEKLGLNGLFRLGNAKKTGEYEFDFSFFTNDRKNFDNSIITPRVSDKKSAATPGDTRSLKSYAASLDVNFDFGKKFLDSEKLSYHFGYLNLAVNPRANTVIPAVNFADQKGFVAGMNYQYPVMENYSIDALLEYQKTRNLGGNSNISENYLTASIINKIYQNWNITLGHASRQNKQVYDYGFDQTMNEVSFGYDFFKTSFFDRFTIQLGYKNQRYDYKTSVVTQNEIGLLARYYKDF